MRTRRRRSLACALISPAQVFTLRPDFAEPVSRPRRSSPCALISPEPVFRPRRSSPCARRASTNLGTERNASGTARGEAGMYVASRARRCPLRNIRNGADRGSVNGRAMFTVPCRKHDMEQLRARTIVTPQRGRLFAAPTRVAQSIAPERSVAQRACSVVAWTH